MLFCYFAVFAIGAPLDGDIKTEKKKSSKTPLKLVLVAFLANTGQNIGNCFSIYQHN